jgi:hypothetical protein
MPNTTIELPDGKKNLPMKKDVDGISFKVTKTCYFCYSDPTPCFPSFLSNGKYTATTPPTTYGPYTPTQDGTVVYNAVTSEPCSTSGPTDTPCSITVSS